MSKNLNGEIANFRDTFLNAEKQYLEQLLSDEELRAYVEELTEYDTDMLFIEAKRLIDTIEYGMVPEEELSQVEAKITLILAAIQDKVLVRRLILLPNLDDDLEQTSGRKR